MELTRDSEVYCNAARTDLAGGQASRRWFNVTIGISSRREAEVPLRRRSRYDTTSTFLLASLNELFTLQSKL